MTDPKETQTVEPIRERRRQNKPVIITHRKSEILRLLFWLVVFLGFSLWLMLR